MRVVQIPLTFHYERLLTFTTLPAWNTSFNPVPSTPHSTPQTLHRPGHRCLSFSSADIYTPDGTPVCSDSSDEEDFQMVPLDDEHWTSEETPDRTFFIHEHGLLHGLCQYPCPYVNYNAMSYMDSLDLSDISDCEDSMVTSSDEILGIEEVPYQYWTLVCLNIYFNLNYNILYLYELCLK